MREIGYISWIDKEWLRSNDYYDRISLTYLKWKRMHNCYQVKDHVFLCCFYVGISLY